MADRHEPVDLLIDGRIYRLSAEDPAYLARVAGYLNTKIAECREMKAYRSLDADYRHVLIDLNIADDVFRREKELELAQKKAEDLEKELYGVRHDIVTAKLKLETLQKEKEELQEQLHKMKQKNETLHKAGDR